MITLDDCEAFCDADIRRIDTLARLENLDRIQACARAHAEHATGTLAWQCRTPRQPNGIPPASAHSIGGR